MKRESKKPGAVSRPKQKPASPGQPLSAARKRLFGLIALSLPFIFLLLLELGLRLAGYGYDTAFFKMERDASGQNFLVHNDQFMFRFFSPELARWPGTFKIAAEKPSDVQRIFIFGESAAMGDPQPSVGASHFLEVLLREKFPDQKFEVVNLGITAINSHVIRPIAQDVAAQGKGDLWLIYMGNNEMVGPFGAATVFGSRAAPMPVVRFNLAVQKTRVGQLALALMRKLGGKSKTASWNGMRMFLKNQIPPDDARRETVYKNFDTNLRDIVQLGERSGAKVVLSTMSVNLRDCPPFASLVNSKLSGADKTQFDSLYGKALALQTNQHSAEAAQVSAQAAKLDSKFAELQFRWGQCLLSETNANAAREHFQIACDVDALPFRADTRINNTIRAVAKEHAGNQFALCDAEAALTSATPDHIAGDESFFEHVHFNFDGNYRLAKAWAEQIAQLLPDTVRRKAVADWASQATCERGIGLSDWNRMFVITSVLSRMQQPPLAAQFNNPIRAQGLQRDLSLLTERQNRTNAVAQARTDFEAAVRRAPTDVSLHENYANFLEATGDAKGALTEYLKIVELLPHDFYGCLQSGRMLGEAQRWAEAEPLLRRAAESRPSLPETWFQLGEVAMAEAKYGEALEHFDRAAKIRPADGSYSLFKARAQLKLNRHVEAIQSYRDAVLADHDIWEAHYELANELEAARQPEAALQEFAEAARVNPRHVVGHVNFGVMLARQNHLDEAIEQFQIALSLDPNNAAANDYLRQVSAWRNKRR